MSRLPLALLGSLVIVLVAVGPACSSSRPPPAPPPPPAAPTPEARLKEALALRAAGDDAAARGKLEAALAASPRSDPVRNELADLLIADGRELDRAAEVLAGADPRDAGPRFHLLSGRLAELRGDDAAGAEAYARAVALGADPEVRFRRALLLDRLARPEEAIAELEALRAARPRDGGVSVALAERYEAAGRFTEAEAELFRAVEAEPGRAAGWDRLARFLARRGREEGAREAEERARALSERPERTLRPLPPSRR